MRGILTIARKDLLAEKKEEKKDDAAKPTAAPAPDPLKDLLPPGVGPK